MSDRKRILVAPLPTGACKKLDMFHVKQDAEQRTERSLSRAMRYWEEDTKKWPLPMKQWPPFVLLGLHQP